MVKHVDIEVRVSYEISMGKLTYLVRHVYVEVRISEVSIGKLTYFVRHVDFEVRVSEESTGKLKGKYG